jgi:hypothetical protein
MAPRKPTRRKARNLRATRTLYPIGTRLAESYGMDLDREAAEGRPGDRLGMPPVYPEPAGRRLLGVSATFLGVGTAVLLVAFALALVLSLSGSRVDFLRAFFRMGPRRVAEPASRTIVTNHYADVRAAGRAGALLDGWVPPFVPEGATDLYERHDPATGEGWLAFQFPPAQGRRMADRLHRVGPAVAGIVTGPNGDWWPSSLRGHIGTRKGQPAWEIYLTPRRSATGLAEYMAIDWESSRAFLWRERE